MDEGFLMTALWFLAGFFVIPWVLKFGLGFVTPFIGISGAMFFYSIIALEVILGFVGMRWHHGLAIGLWAVAVKDVISIFFPLPF